jgi:hypothetical protein
VSEIHDLGYQRYAGPRRPPSVRWRVIMRHELATAWKTWWRYKAALGLAVIVTCGWGALMYFLSNHEFHAMGNAGGLALTFADATLPSSIEWFCRVGFYLSLTLGAGVIAGDVQTGAFTLYFARSVRPRDYVLGKLASYGLLVATLVVVGPLLLAMLRFGVAESTDERIAALVLIPKALAVGGIATIAYATVPLGFSALVPNRRGALALWAAYYMVFGTIVETIGYISGGWIAALDLPTAMYRVTYALFDVNPLLGGMFGMRNAAMHLSLEAALGSIAGHALLAIGLMWYQVSKAQRTGVGASS